MKKYKTKARSRMVGAFLGGVFLNILRAGTPRFFGLLLFQTIGALILIGLVRLITKERE